MRTVAASAGDLAREAIRLTLTQHAGAVPDARAVAEATLVIWGQVASQLTPVIGARGVDALFSRSLHLTSAAFPWLAVPGEQGRPAAQRAGLKARLAGREADAATAAGSALLATFTELLASLIGESLSGRLLGPVWAVPSTEFQRESSS